MKKQQSRVKALLLLRKSRSKPAGASRNWISGAVASVIALAWAMGGIVMPSLAANPEDQVVPGSQREAQVFNKSWESIQRDFVNGLTSWKWSSESDASKILDPAEVGLATNPATPIDVKGSTSYASGDTIGKVGSKVFKPFSCRVNDVKSGGRLFNTTCWAPAEYKPRARVARSAPDNTQSRERTEGARLPDRAVPALGVNPTKVDKPTADQGDTAQTADDGKADSAPASPQDTNSTTPGVAPAPGTKQDAPASDKPVAPLADKAQQLVQNNDDQAGQGTQEDPKAIEVDDEDHVSQAVGAGRPRYGDTTTDLPVSALNASEWEIFSFERMLSEKPLGTTLDGGSYKPNYYYYQPADRGLYYAVASQRNGIPYYSRGTNTYILNAGALVRPFTSRLVEAIIHGNPYYSLCGDPGHFIASHGGIGGGLPETNGWDSVTQSKFQILIWMFYKHPDWFGNNTLQRHKILQFFIWWIIAPGSIKIEHFGPDPALVERIRKELQAEFDKNLQSISEMIRNLKLRGEAVVTDDGGILYHVTLDGYDKFRGDLGKVTLKLEPQRHNLAYTVLDANKNQIGKEGLTLARAGEGFYIKITAEQLAAAGGCNPGSSLFKVTFSGNALVPGVTWKHGTNQAQIIINPVPIYTSGQVDLVCVGSKISKPKLVGTVAGGSQDGKEGQKTVKADKPFTLTDDVQYSGLNPEHKYKIQATLRADLRDNRGMQNIAQPIVEVGKGTGFPIDSSGSGTFKKLFSINMEAKYAKEGNRFVFWEELFAADGKTSLAQHKNDVDANQTVTVVRGGSYVRLKKERRNSAVTPEDDVMINFRVEKYQNRSWVPVGNWDVKANGNTPNDQLPGWHIVKGEKYRITERFNTTSSMYYIYDAYWNVFRGLDERTRRPLYHQGNWIFKQSRIVDEGGNRYQETSIEWTVGSDQLGNDIVVVANNCYQKKVGTISIEKKITDPKAAEAAKGKKFTFKLWRKPYQNSVPQLYTKEGVNPDGTFTVEANGRPHVFYNLPFGYYFVTEENPGAIEGFEYSGVDWDVTAWQNGNLRRDVYDLDPIKIDGKTSSKSVYLDQCNCLYNLKFVATNKYTPADASFTVEKQAVLKDDPASAGTRFLSDSLLADKKFTFAWGCGKKDKSGIFTLKDQESKSFTGIPVGTECTVTETDAESIVPGTKLSQKLTVTSGNTELASSSSNTVTFKMPKRGAQVKVLANNTYLLQKGHFTVKKTVSGTGADLAKGKTFNFQYVCDDLTYTMEVPANGTAIKSVELPVNTKCELFEMGLDHLNVVGQEAKVTIDGKTETKRLNGRTLLGNITIRPSNKPVTVSVDNKVAPKTGGFVLVKKLEGNAAGSATGKDFNFALTCTRDGKTLNDFNSKQLKLQVPSGQTVSSPLSVNGIPVGAKCQLVETNLPNVPGMVNTDTKWDMDGDGAVDTGSTKTSGFFTIGENTRKLTVTAVNTYKKNATYIKVQKVFSGPADLTAEEIDSLLFNFAVQCNKDGVNRNHHVSIRANTLSDKLEAPAGATCVVIEQDPPAVPGAAPQPRVEMSTSGTAINPKADNAKRQITFTVPDKISDDVVVTAVAKNTYVPNNGTFQLVKVNTGDVPSTAKAAEFNFGYACLDSKQKVIKTDTVKVQAGGNPVSVNPGRVDDKTECYVWEEATQAPANTKHEVIWSGTGVEKATYQGKAAVKFKPLVNGASVGTITATNKYTADKGRFTLKKKVVKKGDNVTAETKKPYLFDVSCVYNSQEVFTKQGIPLHDGGEPFTSEEFPVGTICTLTEQDTFAAGHTITPSWEWTATGDSDTHQDANRSLNITIKAKNQQVEITAVNTYQRNFGKFSVKKNVVNQENIDLSLIDREFSFSYTCKDKDGKNAISDKIAGVRGDLSGKGKPVESKPVPVGYTCDVNEDPISADKKVVPTYSLTTTAGQIINNGKTARFEVTDSNTVVALTAINTYTKARGGFEVVKKATGLAKAGQGYTFSFKYSCTYADTPVGGETFTLTTDPSSKKTVSDLPVGSQCVIEETGVTPAIPGMVNKPTWEVNQVPAKAGKPEKGSGPATFTIAENGSVAKLVYTNNYENKMLPLQVVKTNAEGTPGEITSAVKNVTVGYSCKDGNTGTKSVPVGDVNPTQLAASVAYGTECEIWEEALDGKQLNVGADQYNHLVSITVGGKTTQVKPGDRVTFNATADDVVSVAMQNSYSPQPAIGTTLDGKNVHTTRENGQAARGVLQPGTDKVTFTDTVAYRNLPKGSYVLKGQLYSVATSQKVGPEVTSHVLQLEGTNTTQLEFVLERSDVLANPKGLVAFEYLYKSDDVDSDKKVKPGKTPVAKHEDKKDLAQTVIVTPAGEIRTFASANGDKTGVREVPAGQPLTVKDTVQYRNLPKEDRYRLIGLLVKQSPEGNRVVTTTSQDVTVDKSVDQFSDQAQWTMTFPEISKDEVIGGTKFTVLEYLVKIDSTLTKDSTQQQLDAEGATVAKHASLSDLNQTLTVPGLRTHADFTDGSQAGSKTNAQTSGIVKIRDRVTYQQLVPGKDYTITGRLAIKGTNPVQYLTDAAGKEYVKSVTFRATQDDAKGGEKTLVFEVDAERLQGQTVVAFEKMHRDNVEVAVHEDINDEDQTVSSVKLATKAINAATGTQMLLAGEKNNVKDVIEYWGLTPNVEYVFVGELKDTAKIDKTDASTVARAWVTHTPVAPNGTAELTFENVVPEQGAKYVVFERAYLATDVDTATGQVKASAKLVGKHEDPKDPAQTVTAPKVTTDAKVVDGSKDGSKLVDPAADFEIIDVVTYSGLDPEKTYTVDGELMIKDGTREGKPTGIKQTVQIGQGTAHEIDPSGNGKVEMTFTVTARQAQDLGLIGKPIVAFETVNQDGKTVAIHHDINDEAQTVYTFKIATVAKTGDGKKEAVAGKDLTIKDTVSFEGRLEASGKYALVGTLMEKYFDKSVGKYVIQEAQGAKASPLFFETDKAGQPTKELVMNFTVPAAQVQKDHDLVVFETLYRAADVDKDGKVKSDAKPLGQHADINDQAQTLKVPSLNTTATDSPKGDKNGGKNLAPVNDVVTVYDRVDYTGLIPGKEYELKGQLYYQADATLAGGSQVKKGDPVPGTETTARFTPTKPDGSYVMTLTVPALAVLGQAVVTFEDLYRDGIPVGSHHDINDENQTVYLPKVKTVATNAKDQSKTIQAGTDAQVKDQMTWQSLAPGEYVAVGSVHNPADSTQITEVKTQVKPFTVAKGQSTGTVDLTFDIPAKLAEKLGSFVVFEKVYKKGDVDEKTGAAKSSAKPVASHEDPTDTDQTVSAAKVTTEATDAADGDKYVDASEKTGEKKTVSIKDEVFYEGLNPAYTYTITGQLHQRTADGKDGGVVGESQSLKIGPKEDIKVDPSGKGSVILTFTVDASLVAGKHVVTFEDVRDEHGGLLIHHDINDDAQTVYAHKLATQARVDGASRLVTGQAGVVIDTVSYDGLIPGAKYRVEGVLTKNGERTNYTAKSDEFEAKARSGKLELKFEVDAKHGFTKDDKIVVFEKLIALTGKVAGAKGKVMKDAPIVKLPDNTVVARHEDPNDAAQTVTTGNKPSIKTLLWANGHKRTLGDGKLPIIGPDTANVTDTITYDNLEVGVPYMAYAQLVVVDAAGKVVETKNFGQSNVFRPESPNGTVDVTVALTDRAALVPGQKVVAYETLYRLDREPGKGEPPAPSGGNAPGPKVAEHKDPKDPNQTGYVKYSPSIGTSLADAKGQKVVTPDSGDITLVDTVTYKGLTVGKNYVLAAKLMQKVEKGGQVTAADTGIRALAQFTAAKSDDTQKVEFTIPAAKLQQWLAAGGQPQVVAFEQLWDASRVTINADSKTVTPNGTVTVPGMDAKTPDAAHEDINDAAQTVRLVSGPAIGTQLGKSAPEKEDVIFAGDSVKLVDHVSYHNLLPETQYIVAGELMVPGDTVQTSTPTGIKADSKPFTTPKAKNGEARVSGTVDVTFTLTAEHFQKYPRLVAFEKLYLGTKIEGNPVTTHEDPKDPNQTVSLKEPKIGTQAAGKDGGKSINVQTGKHVKDTEKVDQIVTDRVRYDGLQAGETYALTGQLHLQKVGANGQVVDGGVLKDAKGNEITASATFVAKDGENTVDVMKFKVPYGLLKNGENFVVFEQLYAPGSFTAQGTGSDAKVTPNKDAKPIATHNVIDAKSQTLEVNNPEFGDFTFTKHVTGQWNDSAVPAEKRANLAYNFKYTCVDKDGHLLAAHSTDWITLKENESRSVTGIPEGAKCTLEENVTLAEQATASKVKVTWMLGGKPLSSVGNGKVTFTIGAEDGKGGRVYSYNLDVNNELTPNPALATNTTGKNGNLISAHNGGEITDVVSYYNIPAGLYHLHTYFRQKVVSDDGKISFKPINWIPSVLNTVKSEGGNGAWTVKLQVPVELAHSGDLIVWEDLYRFGEFDQNTQGPKKGAKVFTFHHEEYTPGEKGSTQAVRFTSQLSGFQLAKAVKIGDGVDVNLGAQLKAREFNFDFKCELPIGLSGKFPDLKLADKVKLKDGGKSVSYWGYPADTVCTFTEADLKDSLPTTVGMDTKWSVQTADGKPVTNEGSTGFSFRMTLGVEQSLVITATNEFKPVEPKLETIAHVGDGKQLKPGANQITDTVTYDRLVPGRQYLLQGSLHYAGSGEPVLSNGKPVVSEYTTVTASDTGKGTWDKVITLTAPADVDPNQDIVFYEVLYEFGNGKTPGPEVVSHKDPKDDSQKVYRAPERKLETVASVVVENHVVRSGTFEAGTPVTVRDAVTYSGLPLGSEYQLVGTIMAEGKTQVGNTVVMKVKADKESGTWTMDLPLSGADTAKFDKETALVVFERLYPASADLRVAQSPLVEHADKDSRLQTVYVQPRKTPPPPVTTTVTTPGTPPPPYTPPTVTTTVTVPPPPAPPTSPSTTTPGTPGTPPDLPVLPTVTAPQQPPVLPTVTLPPKVPNPQGTLARTGAQATIVGALSLLMIGAGAAIGLLAARRRRNGNAS